MQTKWDKIITREVLEEEYVRNKLTDLEIAQKYNCSQSTVSSFRVKQNIKRNPRRRRYKDILTKEVLKREYVDNGLSDYKIAKKYKCNHLIVWCYRTKYYNIASRCKEHGKILTYKMLKKEYIDNKLSDIKIGKKYDCPPGSVWALRVKYGIKTIPQYTRHEGQKLTRIQKEFLFGTLLGDGSIDPQGYFQVTHCAKQKLYLEWKCQILGNFVETPIKLIQGTTGFRSKKFYYYFRTYSHPIFRNLRDLFYPKGKKEISLKILSELTPLSLAVWYMDDGGVSFRQAIGKRRVKLATCGYTKKEHYILKDWFKNKYEINVSIVKQGKYFVTSFSQEETEKFIKLIKEHVTIPCMEYKIRGTSREK